MRAAIFPEVDVTIEKNKKKHKKDNNNSLFPFAACACGLVFSHALAMGLCASALSRAVLRRSAEDRGAPAYCIENVHEAAKGINPAAKGIDFSESVPDCGLGISRLIRNYFVEFLCQQY